MAGPRSVAASLFQVSSNLTQSFRNRRGTCRATFPHPRPESLISQEDILKLPATWMRAMGRIVYRLAEGVSDALEGSGADALG